MANLFLFDIDGTLVNLTEVHVQAYLRAYEEVTGFRIPREQILRQFGKPERPMQDAVLRNS